MTLSTMGLIETLSINDTPHDSFSCNNAECHYAVCRIFYSYAECRFAECRFTECHYGEYCGADTLLS